jgi:hypothetical protein
MKKQNTFKTQSTTPSVYFKKNTIQYVNGLCGSGKTYALTRFLSNQIQSNKRSKSLIVVPTIELSNQYETAFQDIGTEYTVINSQYSGNTQRAIIDAVKQINFIGDGILLITLSSFNNISTSLFSKSIDWDVYVDEIPAIDKFYDPCIPYTYTKLFDLLDVIDYELPEFKQLSLSKFETVDYINRHFDENEEVFKNIAKDVLDGNMVLIDSASYNKLSTNDITPDAGIDMENGNEFNKLFILSILTPVKWFKISNNITIMGANFEESMLYKYWGDFCGVNFVESHLSNSLRYNQHTNGSLLDVRYCSEYHTSKYHLNKVSGGVSNFNKNINIAAKHFDSNNNVLVVVNNADREKIQVNNWSLAPVISHGLNHFDHYTQVYFGAALNRKPKHIKMLTDFGFDSIYITRATSHEVLYQGVMRTALRRPDNTKVVTAIVADKAMAEHLARLFPGCLLGPVDGVSKKTVAKSQVNRDKLHKKKQILTEQRHLTNSHFSPFNINAKTTTKSLSIGKRSKNGVNVADINVSVFPNIKTSTSIDDSFRAVDFIKQLKTLWTNNIVDHKSDNFLMNSVVYKTKENRKSNNAVYSTALFLDIDDGNMTAEECHKILSDNKISHILTNSASRKQDQLNRYRAIIFVKEVMTAETHKIVFNYIVNLFKENGFYTIPLSNKQEYITGVLKKDIDARFTGIDMSKNNLSSIFYAPCKVRGNEDYAFFWKFGVKDEEITRYALNPTAIVKHSVEKTELQPIDFVEDLVELPNNEQYAKLIVVIDKTINEIAPGNRSSLACKVGGLLSKIDDIAIKEKYLDKIVSLGVDKSAMKQARKYAYSN